MKDSVHRSGRVAQKEELGCSPVKGEAEEEWDDPQPPDNDRGSLTMTEAQFELLLAANRGQYEELQAIHPWVAA
jgi:hypothetical protein